MQPTYRSLNSVWPNHIKEEFECKESVGRENPTRSNLYQRQSKCMPNAYLSGYTRTPLVLVKYGVPQRSVLGPLSYLLYTADIPVIFSKHSSSGHLYADDVLAFVHGSSDQLALNGRINALS